MLLAIARLAGFVESKRIPLSLHSKISAPRGDTLLTILGLMTRKYLIKMQIKARVELDLSPSLASPLGWSPGQVTSDVWRKGPEFIGPPKSQREEELHLGNRWGVPPKNVGAGGQRMPRAMRQRSTQKLKKSVSESLGHLHVSPGTGWFYRSSWRNRVKVLGEQEFEKYPRCTMFCLLYSGKVREPLSSFFQTLDSKLDITISKRLNLCKTPFLISCMLYGMPISLHRIRASQLG